MSPAVSDQAAARRKRIDEERRRRPESEVWLRLLALALEAAESPAWMGLQPRLPSARAAGAPVLHEAIVAVDRRAARRWVRTLLKAASSSTEGGAASLRGLRGRDVDPVRFLADAVVDDRRSLGALAERAGVHADALGAVAPLAALPLLRGCAAAVESRLPVGWDRGFCSACGGWPSLAELRGLERTRVLRCGRCATAWEIPVLVCPFCDERDHARQLSFAPEGEEHQRRVDACRGCGGYIKTRTTLAALRPWALPLEDLATIELDLVAGERGFGRPASAGFETDLRVIEGGTPGGTAAGGWA